MGMLVNLPPDCLPGLDPGSPLMKVNCFWGKEAFSTARKSSPPNPLLLMAVMELFV